MLNVNTTLSPDLTASAQAGSITITHTTPHTSVGIDGEEHTTMVEQNITMSYMDVTRFVEFARLAGWKSRRS